MNKIINQMKKINRMLIMKMKKRKEHNIHHLWSNLIHFREILMMININLDMMKIKILIMNEIKFKIIFKSIFSKYKAPIKYGKIFE